MYLGLTEQSRWVPLQPIQVRVIQTSVVEKIHDVVGCDERCVKVVALPNFGQMMMPGHVLQTDYLL